MNLLKNFLILIICPIIINLIYWIFTKLFFILDNLSMFWMVIAIIFIGVSILGLFMGFVLFLMKYLVRVSPNVNFTFWVVKISSIVFAILQLYYIWSSFGGYSIKLKILTIIYSIFLIYIGSSFKTGVEKAYNEDL